MDRTLNLLVVGHLLEDILEKKYSLFRELKDRNLVSRELELLECMDKAVTYLRENLGELGIRRLESVYRGEGVREAVERWFLFYQIDPLLDVTVRGCYSQIKDKPESIPEVYHLFGWFSHNLDIPTEERIAIMEQGIEFHPDELRLYYNLMVNHLNGIEEAKNGGRWLDALSSSLRVMDLSRKSIPYQDAEKNRYFDYSSTFSTFASYAAMASTLGVIKLGKVKEATDLFDVILSELPPDLPARELFYL